ALGGREAVGEKSWRFEFGQHVLARRRVAYPVGAQFGETLLEVLRQLLDDFLLAYRSEPERLQPAADLILPILHRFTPVARLRPACRASPARGAARSPPARRRRAVETAR